MRPFFASTKEKYYSGKIDSKRKQLSSVQMLFKSFAEELESGNTSRRRRRGREPHQQSGLLKT